MSYEGLQWVIAELKLTPSSEYTELLAFESLHKQ